MHPTAARETYIARFRDRQDVGLPRGCADCRRGAKHDGDFVLIVPVHQQGIPGRKIDFEYFDSVIFQHQMVMCFLI
jgi:hypothetical protein